MSASSVNGLAGDYSVQNFEFAVPDGFVAERAFTGAPLETLDYRVFDRGEEILVDFRRKRVVDQDVGT